MQGSHSLSLDWSLPVAVAFEMQKGWASILANFSSLFQHMPRSPMCCEVQVWPLAPGNRATPTVRGWLAAVQSGNRRSGQMTYSWFRDASNAVASHWLSHCWQLR